ncbi:tRNA (guanosine(37)-N1)-methyltransferase TrmD [Jannaschia aquimarina]|uniref:tRNA (guanine-N(1)-)-methyltransferase n=1 Tax=Jannaschia aquimarina TaxID=935700 RepID=A0A0D1EA82_9RHOB|nr:tRNA (guanosine(37)-N1)-methyltransferase TrmD [Jannaschia aquimarina]KIT14594.1 tRNA (guanine-N(1)-)-methyltransferase [Jannaschia aquimarina]SNS77040.1 tRNA (Guanine37-N(1)-) methyltransferase [Jannaschia aquimarina]
MTTPARSHGTKSIRPTARPRDLMEDAPGSAWQARVVTLFPEAFPGILGLSLTGQALRAGLWHLRTIPLREFGLGRHRSVDAPPSGGGAGLVLRPDVVGPALDAAAGPGPVLYLSPRGRPFDQAMARSLAAGPGATLLCGRFEGVDQRVLEAHEAVEVSLGDFVMTGGEIAAQAVLDATIRLLPGVVGNADSLEEESFSSGLLEHPHYTKPAEWEGRATPPVLLSGDHAKVADWRRAESERLTRERRPDLLARRDEEAPDDETR